MTTINKEGAGKCKEQSHANWRAQVKVAKKYHRYLSHKPHTLSFPSKKKHKKKQYHLNLNFLQIYPRNVNWPTRKWRI